MPVSDHEHEREQSEESHDRKRENTARTHSIGNAWVFSGKFNWLTRQQIVVVGGSSGVFQQITINESCDKGATTATATAMNPNIVAYIILSEYDVNRIVSGHLCADVQDDFLLPNESR